jgi:hypothetical protein
VILEAEAGPEPVPVVCSLDEERSTESDSDKEGTFKGLGEGTYSPDDDTARGNGIPEAVKNVSSPPSSSVSFAPSSGLHRFGMYIPFLFPAVTALLRVPFLRSPTRLEPEPGPEPPPPSVVPLSGLDSRGSGSRDVSLGCGASIGVSTLCRARCVGRRPARGEGTSGDGGEAEVGKEPRSAANSSSPMTRGVSAERDTINEDREGGFLIAIGRVGEDGGWNASRKSSGHLP